MPGPYGQDPIDKVTQQTNPPTVNLEKGDYVMVEPKSPLKSTAIWGLIVMGATAVAQKYLPSYMIDQGVQAILEFLGWIIGAALVAYGRWTATRPLGFSNSKSETMVKMLLVGLLTTATLTTTTGCQQFWNDLKPAPIETGDPITVNLERSTRQITDIIDTFLTLDDENREYFKTNLPALHTIAEQVRRQSPALLKDVRDLTKLYKATSNKTTAATAQQKLDLLKQMSDQAKKALMTYESYRQTTGK